MPDFVVIFAFFFPIVFIKAIWKGLQQVRERFRRARGVSGVLGAPVLGRWETNLYLFLDRVLPIDRVLPVEHHRIQPLQLPETILDKGFLSITETGNLSRKWQDTTCCFLLETVSVVTMKPFLVGAS